MKKLSICFAFLALSLLTSGHAFGSIDFGICGSAVEIREANWPYIDQLFSHMAETNIKSIRVSFPMAYGAENQSNEYLIKVAKYNAFLDKCDSNGIDVLLLLAYGSEFFYKDIYDITGCVETVPPGGLRYKFPPQDAYWRDCVHEVMIQFGDRVSGVEVWNEEDHIGNENDFVTPDWVDYFFHGRVEDYKVLFGIALEEIKALFPDMKVSIGGLACRAPIYRSYLEALINPSDGILESADAIGIHCYQSTALERLRIYPMIAKNSGYERC